MWAAVNGKLRSIIRLPILSLSLSTNNFPRRIRQEGRDIARRKILFENFSRNRISRRRARWPKRHFSSLSSFRIHVRRSSFSQWKFRDSLYNILLRWHYSPDSREHLYVFQFVILFLVFSISIREYVTNYRSSCKLFNLTSLAFVTGRLWESERGRRAALINN